MYTIRYVVFHRILIMKEQCFLDFSMRIQLKWRLIQEVLDPAFPTSLRPCISNKLPRDTGVAGLWTTTLGNKLQSRDAQYGRERIWGNMFIGPSFPFPGRISFAFLHLLKSVLKRTMNTDGSACSIFHLFWDRKRLKMTDPASPEARTLEASLRRGWQCEC